MKAILLHWYRGCAKFNRRWPHWVRDDGHRARHAKCAICGGNAWWQWGHKNFLPDVVAQDIQGVAPDENNRYWAEHDGHRIASKWRGT